MLELSLHLEVPSPLPPSPSSSLIGSFSSQTVSLPNFILPGKNLAQFDHRPRVDPSFLSPFHQIAMEINFPHFQEVIPPLFTSTALFSQLHSLYLEESNFPSLSASSSAFSSPSFSLEHYLTRHDLLQNIFLDLFSLYLSTLPPTSHLPPLSSSSLLPYFPFHFTVQYPPGHMSHIATATNTNPTNYIFLFSQATRICLQAHRTHHHKLCHPGGLLPHAHASPRHPTNLTQEQLKLSQNSTRNTLFKDITHYYRINPFLPATKNVIRLYFLKETHGSSSSGMSFSSPTFSLASLSASAASVSSPPPLECKYREVEIKSSSPFHMWLLIRDLKRCVLQKQLFHDLKNPLHQHQHPPSSSSGSLSDSPPSPHLLSSRSRDSLLTQLPDPFFWESSLESHLPDTAAAASRRSSTRLEKMSHYSAVSAPVSIRSSSLFKSSTAPLDCNLHFESYTIHSSNNAHTTTPHTSLSPSSPHTTIPMTHISEMKIQADPSADSALLSVFPQPNALSTLTLEKTINLDSLVFADLNCDYHRTSELLIQVQISRVPGLLKPQIYDILPITYAIIKLCGLTAYKSPNLREMHARNVIANTIFLPITTISDGITNLIVEGESLLPSRSPSERTPLFRRGHDHTTPRQRCLLHQHR
jgi:hypothetical protein